MAKEEQREQVIQSIANMLRQTSFTFKFEVKKNPSGIKVIYEVTQEQMDNIVTTTKNNKKQ